MRLLSTVVLVVGIIAWMSFMNFDEQTAVNSMTVQEVLSELGDQSPNVLLESVEGYSAEIGYDIWTQRRVL